MIKPTDLDFSSPTAALLSAEQVRFKGYDLEAENAVVTTLEDNTEFTLVNVKLTSPSGKVTNRQVKAFKNPEAPNTSQQAFTATLITVTSGHAKYVLNVADSTDLINGFVYSRPAGSNEEFVKEMYENHDPAEEFSLSFDVTDATPAYEVYFETEVDGKVLTSQRSIATRPLLSVNVKVLENKFERFTFQLEMTGGYPTASTDFSAKVYSRIHGSGQDFVMREEFFGGSDNYSYILPATDEVKAYDIYFEVHRGAQTVTTPVVTYQQPEPPFKFSLSPKPSIIHDSQVFDIIITPADMNIGSSNIRYTSPGLTAEMDLETMKLYLTVDRETVEDLTELAMLMSINGFELEFDMIYEKTNLSE